ncbi:MAG: hypothetical protein JNM17_34340 [Archangium sp.]|nr:hypothetical protein [Archangium sp.]
MKQTFVAYIKRGSPEERKPKKLPPKLKALLDKPPNDPEKFAKALEPFLTANFVTENIGELGELIRDEGDLFAKRVTLHGAAPQGKGALPNITAEAFFDFELVGKKKLTDEKLELWQDENDYLTDAVNFFWKLDDETLILIGEHEGAGFGVAS